MLFSDNEDNIKQLTYLNDELDKINKEYNKVILNIDIACKIETNKGINYIVFIDNEIIKISNFTKGLLSYKTILKKNNLYENCFVIGLTLNSEKDSNYNSLTWEKDSNSTNVKFIKIIEINIRKELENIKNNIPIEINGKEIKNKGKEYLKLLGIRYWGKKDGRKYIIPDISLISSNDSLINCIRILGSISQNEITLIELDEQFYEDIMNEREEEGMKIGLLKSAYILFASGNEEQIEVILNNNNVKLDKNKIREILKGNIEEVIEEFIKYLELHNYL